MRENLVLNKRTYWQKGDIIIKLANPIAADLQMIFNFRKRIPLVEVHLGGMAYSLGGEEDEEELSRKILYELSNRKIVVAVHGNVVVGEGIFSKDTVDELGVLPEYRGKKKPEYQLSYVLFAALLSLSRASGTWKILVRGNYIKVVKRIVEIFEQLAKELDLEIEVKKNAMSALVVEVELKTKVQNNFDKKVIMLLAKHGWRMKRFK